MWTAPNRVWLATESDDIQTHYFIPAWAAHEGADFAFPYRAGLSVYKCEDYVVCLTFKHLKVWRLWSVFDSTWVQLDPRRQNKWRDEHWTVTGSLWSAVICVYTIQQKLFCIGWFAVYHVSTQCWLMHSSICTFLINQIVLEVTHFISGPLNAMLTQAKGQNLKSRQKRAL